MSLTSAQGTSGGGRGGAGPRVRAIAVANIGFGPDSGPTPEEQAECELGKELFEELHDEVGQSLALSGASSSSCASRGSRGQSAMSGLKRIVLEGQLIRDGQVTADFMAMRFTTQGSFGNHSRGFQTTCGIMEDIAEELAEDVGKWLYRPTMNARLGDL